MNMCHLEVGQGVLPARSAVADAELVLNVKVSRLQFSCSFEVADRFFTKARTTAAVGTCQET